MKCNLCREREAKKKRSDRQGHSVLLCQECNEQMKCKKMGVREIISLVLSQQGK